MNRKLEPQLNTGGAKELYNALAQIEDPDNMAYFLRDLLTIEEIEEAIRRFEAAKMLKQGRTFREISSKTKMSSTTIARINYWIHHGTGGYRKALEKLT